MQQDHLKEWFVFTKRDRNAAIILLCIIAVLMALPYLFPAKKLEIHIDKELQAELEQYRRHHPQNNHPYNAEIYIDTTISDSVKPTLFFFDPNTLNEEGFIKLGLSQKTAHTLINYRSKGGYFKTPEDIRKIYSLSKADADRLIPYIRISSTVTTSRAPADKYETSFKAAQIHQLKKTNINTATIEEWKAFPGIGDVIANRIVKFRTSIGGFKQIDQVGKTYGLSDSVFQLIKPYLYLKDSSGTGN